MQDVLDKEDIISHQSLALDLLNSGDLSIEETQNWLDMIYGTCKITDVQPLLGLLSNKSKILRKTAEELINLHEEATRPLLESGLSKLKGDALAAGKRIIKRWDNERKFGADFTFTKASSNIATTTSTRIIRNSLPGYPKTCSPTYALPT